jgi:hypothetical protein
MLTLLELHEIAQSSDHDGHIARTILSIIKELKLGEISLGVAKLKIYNIFARYQMGIQKLPNKEQLKSFKKDFCNVDLAAL